MDEPIIKVEESIEFFKNQVKARLMLLIYKEAEQIVALCPSLNLSAYGDSKKDVLSSFEYILLTFFNDFPSQHEIDQELKSLGWSMSDHHFERAVSKIEINADLSKSLIEHKAHTFQSQTAYC